MNANEAWIALFRRIPGHLHNTLALGITTGAEIVLQKIVKLEPDFMIIRGRLAGTQDSGRVVIVPYEQLTFVAIQHDLKDTEVETLFGNGAPRAVTDPPNAAPELVAEDATVNEEQPPVNPVKRPAPVSQSALAAKLRDPLKDFGK